MPLLIEAVLMSLIAFSVGLLIAYFVARRRQWIR